MFSKTFIATLLASSAAASPIVSARAAGDAFGLISIRSGSDIQNQAITASGGRLWIGKETASYCPDTVVTDCPNGTSTTFVAGESNLGLNTEVPGGQQVYIATDSSVSYTIPHSGDIHGGVASGWKYTAGENGSLGSLSFPGYGFIACPGEGAGVYGIFLTPGGAATGNCTGISVATVPYTGEGPSAWEYA
ncbi:uncharacterized protein EAF01_000541 [Botrytis porri]|uniref:IgE-binding protein n=1 Tax=Botrytis porri TaxID=87229 RepID=A0A4Z1KHX8_9HELO|nr:uncharacterized protein EAF01_000537 [Botrytis porri]XP_038775697.1 uncharacterized protein EAF01_000541 [Botrytis porri]KAF7914131.1 hypothetical protein EAF01_000537 [Botrytis porri]KAF7914135.1 hypothetical protein EAF01_000541 [Botrytis porri]TGO81067.1 hypothetical protein BPOR_1378g00010 [Botrytis porri]